MNFFFYDLETSGLDKANAHIMQFAGQRTDENLNLIGDAVNIRIQLPDYCLPSPQALVVTGISPYDAQENGMTELEFCRFFINEIALPDTVFVGYNNIRYDDEIIRFTLWRNFYDPYQWHWQDNRSRWDLLDVMRMLSALRPDGLNWALDEDGCKIHKLELLAQANHIEHMHAHDALSDVFATIGLAKLVLQKYPKYFRYMLKNRDKKELQNIINLRRPQAFVYSSGRYDKRCTKTTVAYPVYQGDNFNEIWVYNLRHAPEFWQNIKPSEMENVIAAKKEVQEEIPLKKIKLNRAPAVATISVLDKDDGWNRIGLNSETVYHHKQKIQENSVFIQNMIQCLNQEWQADHELEVEEQLYQGFIQGGDVVMCQQIRNLSWQNPEELKNIKTEEFNDNRLPNLFSHYKCRYFPQTASARERDEYRSYRKRMIERQDALFPKDWEEVMQRNDLNEHQQCVLADLSKWRDELIKSIEK
ncbi:MAG: exodeoxyribonuclease I [Neisseriaceae bacterium]|nr:exodeoxyribonuclease I [Neisseriaceae bacterium]